MKARRVGNFGPTPPSWVEVEMSEAEAKELLEWLSELAAGDIGDDLFDALSALGAAVGVGESQ